MGKTNAEHCKNYYQRKKAAKEAERARLGLSVIKPRRKTGAERNRAYRLRKKMLSQVEGSSVAEILSTPSTSSSRIRTFAPSFRVVESTLARNKKGLPAVVIATQCIETNTNSIGEIHPGRSNTTPMNFVDIKVEPENVDEITMGIQHEIISWREIKKSTAIYLQSNNICDKILHEQISVPKTIMHRLKPTPAKHDSPVDSQINTLLLPHDTQDMVNDRDDDDDVIIIDKVPEVIVIPSDDTPNNDLPCVIANIKSEPLVNELQTSKTKHTVTPQNDFECKTLVTQIPKDTKDVFKCLSDGNSINDDKVLAIEEIKREPELKGNSELNVSMESTFGIINTQSMTTNNVNTVNNKQVGRPADTFNNLDQITPKESEVSEPLKEEENVETFVEIDIPWDAVPIKEEADPEMDLKLSDIRSLYHVEVNVGENEIDVKREINEFDLTGQSENLQQDNSAYNSHFITITPNVALNTDDESNQTQRKKEMFRGQMRLQECLPVYKCKICNKTFSDSSNFSTVKVHNFQILICDICKKKFTNKAYLAKHIKENSSTIEADQVQTTSYAVPKTKDKKLKRKSEYELMQLAVNCLRQKPDEYENWAASCAADLKKMEPTQQIFAKSAIAAIIMEGQLGLLHRNSVEINTPTVTITPSPTYTRSTPTPTNYNSTPSPRYSELPPEELPHYQQNMDNSQQENDANDVSIYKA